MDSHITKTLEDFATRLPEMEQNFSTLTARMCKVETHAASASHVSGSARSWPSREQVDGSTAAGSHGPGSSDDNRNTRRRLDTLSPKMNNSVVPFYFDSLANNTTKGLQSGSITFGKNPICQRATNLSKFIAKQVLCQSGLFLKHEPNVRTSLLDFRMMVSLMQLTVPSAVPILQVSLSANPKQFKTERSDNNLRLC